MNALLPPNSTPFERAIDDAGAARLEPLFDAPANYQDPATCPPKFLSRLAWALSVDHWRSDWPEAVKRAVIAASPRVHRLKGTVAAVRAAVEAFVPGARLIEWFSPEGRSAGMPRFSAVVEAAVAPAPGSAVRLAADVAAAARAAAPVRARLSVRMRAHVGQSLAIAARPGRPIVAARLTVEIE